MEKIITIGILTLAFTCPAKDQVGDLLSRLNETTDSYERVQIISRDLWDQNDPRVEHTFTELLSTNQTEEAYFIAQYLGKTGNTNALMILVKNDFKYPISSMQWSCTLKEFGNHKFEPAIPVLISDLDAVSLNVVNEAFNALRKFYPDSPEQFQSVNEMKSYFNKRYKSPNQRKDPTSVNAESSSQ